MKMPELILPCLDLHRRGCGSEDDGAYSEAPSLSGRRGSEGEAC